MASDARPKLITISPSDAAAPAASAFQSQPTVIRLRSPSSTYVTGVLGMVVFIAYGAMWGLAFAGFPYAIALKTGNPAAVNSSFILFFPFAFLTTSFLPQEALTGWLETIATYNPVTYVLDGLRSLISEGWEWDTLAKGAGASFALMVVSFGLASLAMRGRITRV